MIHGNIVLAYHGCDITTRDALVSGRLTHLKHSENRYDWLGDGSYFFEGDLERAMLFAQASHANPFKLYTRQPIATPAVVGALLRVDRWLDMTMQDGIREFGLAYEAQGEMLRQQHVNEAADEDDKDVILRGLDRALINFIHSTREPTKASPYYFQAVRGAFKQGREIAPGSGFHVNSHIQIAVRDDSCLVGWFLPPKAQLLNADQLIEAQERLDSARAQRRKPIRRRL